MDIRLDDGDRLGLLGRNGSGKSTLLKVLAGIYQPSRGQVRVNGTVSSVFNASLGFLPAATGYENVYIRGALLGLSQAQMAERSQYIADFSELGEWLSRPVSTYSSGMALRLAFAITTSVEADILLLDEWLGAGDAEFVAKARTRMHELIAKSGIMVLATHNLQMMSSICNKVAVLDGGKIVLLGPVEEVIPEYRKRLQKRSN